MKLEEGTLEIGCCCWFKERVGVGLACGRGRGERKREVLFFVFFEVGFFFVALHSSSGKKEKKKREISTLFFLSSLSPSPSLLFFSLRLLQCRRAPVAGPLALTRATAISRFVFFSVLWLESA